MKLTPSFSSYLDFLRFGAALAVLLGHMVQDGFALGAIPIAHLSHEAVVVFFVMSGYIVYASTTSRQISAVEYVVARASRIYSVTLPAVVFCVVLSVVVAAAVPALAAQQPSWRPFSVADVVGSLTFLNESWAMPTDLTLNGPYWSLCYEVWYYVLFGIAFFGRGRWRWPLFCLAALVAGPAIMVLFPVWVFGAWLASNPNRRLRVSAGAAVAIWIGSFVLVWLMQVSNLDQFAKSWLHDRVPGFWRLEAGQRLFTDYAVALMLGAHLAVYGSLPAAVQTFFIRSRNLWTALAGFSFTLYLFHRPLTALAGRIVSPEHQTVPLAVVVLVLVLAFCWLASFVTERQLPSWRSGMRRLLNRFGLRASPTAGGGIAG